MSACHYSKALENLHMAAWDIQKADVQQFLKYVCPLGLSSCAKFEKPFQSSNASPQTVLIVSLCTLVVAAGTD